MPSHPDADLHPTATGSASALVSAHASEQPLKLYAGWFCPFVQRTWIVLEEKKIPYQYIEVNPYNKPQSLLTLNPRGLVPTLQYDNKPLYESVVIGEFLHDAYPTHGAQLLPHDPYTRARSRLWTDFISTRIIPAFHRFLQYQTSSDEGIAGLEKRREEFLGTLKEWTREMDERGPWFFGGEAGLVDFALAPWAVRLWVFDHFKGGLGIPAEGQGGEDEKVWARWRKWSQAVESRDSVKKTLSEREFYLPIYQRYADDKAQSELAKATREGRGVP